MRPGSAVPVVEVEGLWEGYRAKTRRGWRRRGEPKWALSDVSFDVAPGEMLGIIGANGSGKSTLLECIAGVLRPSRGRVSTRGRVTALVDLSAGFHRELTGRENLLIAGVLGGLSRAEVRDVAPRVAEFAELEDDALNSPLRTYSAGMGLRLGFALAVHTCPTVLAVDEVLAVGDEQFQAKCLAKVRDLRAQGCGVVLVSHELDLVESECARVVVLDQGRLCFLGAPDDAVAFYRARHGGLSEMSEAPPGVLFGRGRRRRERRGA